MEIYYNDSTVSAIVKRVIPIIHDLRIEKIRLLEVAELNNNIRKNSLSLCRMSINNFTDDLIELLKGVTEELDG